MKRFVAGKVVKLEGEYGMYHELKLLLENGQIIPVFYSRPRIIKKEDDAISPLLSLNSFYEFLLIVRVRKFTYEPAMPEGAILQLIPEVFPANAQRATSFTRNDVVQGIVIDPDWSPEGLSYLGMATPKILENRYVLVKTAIGKAAISHKVIDEQLGEQASEIAVGGYLEFPPARLDIMAILSKDEE